jgi:hypothetical protein
MPRRRRLAIDVESCEPADRWAAAGRRLADLEPAEFRRLLELAEAFVRLHDDSLESRALFNARVAAITGKRGEGN